MTLRRVALPIIAGVIALTMAVRDSSAQTAEFATTAKIDQASLKSNFFKQASRFYVEVTVRNTSTVPKTITVWLNPGWSWVTDSKDVGTSQEALMNSPRNTTLQPGEIYKSSIEMWATPKTRRPITFRLGFLPKTQRPVQDAQDPALFWSNPITLTE
jgi:hypothetical protein